MELHLSKHQGAGNDFLVVVDPDDRVRLSADQVRGLCDRHFGVGADGVIRVGRGRRPADLPQAPVDSAPVDQAQGAGAATDLWMELRNADGGEAEMSGNGIRCLAQAAVDAGLVAPPTFTVDTLAGVRTVEYVPGDTPGTAWASVDMGAVRLGPEQPAPVHGNRARRVDVGNPHLVLLGTDDPAGVDVATVGAALEAATPGGVNVELIAVGPGADELTLRVWERGVGETMACGTGSCAAAAAARAWGVVGDVVLVHNPGGTLQVRLGAADTDPVLLAGPTARVADVDADLAVAAAASQTAPVPA